MIEGLESNEPGALMIFAVGKMFKLWT